MIDQGMMAPMINVALVGQVMLPINQMTVRGGGGGEYCADNMGDSCSC